VRNVLMDVNSARVVVGLGRIAVVLRRRNWMRVSGDWAFTKDIGVGVVFSAFKVGNELFGGLWGIGTIGFRLVRKLSSS